MNKREKIVLLLDSRGMGGIETHVITLARALKDSGNDVEIVLYKDYEQNPMLKEIISEKLLFTILSGNIFSLVRYLLNMKPKILHTHGYKAGILGRLIGKVAKIPVVSTFHAGEPGEGKLRFYNYLDHLSAPLAKCIAVSNSIKKRLPADAIVINNFVHKIASNAMNCNSKSVRKIAYVGRVSYEKGPDLYVQLANQSTGYEFYLYGDGPMRKNLQLNTKSVVFKGQVASMDQHWNNVDILCITSRFEGLPMVAIEAMSRGIPVIAFNVGNMSNLIDQQDLGSLIVPYDIEAMQIAIDQWKSLSNSCLEQRKLKMVSHIRKHYSSEYVLPQILSIYHLAQVHS